MDLNQTPSAIQNFIKTTNSADNEGFLQNFKENAILTDWGTIYSGVENIAKWNKTDNIGKQSNFELVSIDKIEDNLFRTIIKVKGNGYNGNSPFVFEINEDKLVNVEIPSS